MEEYTHPTLDKIASLRKRMENAAYADDLDKIGSWASAVKDLVAREDLAGNPVLDSTLEDLRKEAQDFEHRLRTEDSTKLPDAQRDRLLDKIALYNGFIGRFDIKTIREELESIDKMVDEELAHLN